MVKSLRIRLLVLTESTNVTDRQTDRRTDTAWRHRPRLCIASRGKNLLTATMAKAGIVFKVGKTSLSVQQSAVGRSGRNVWWADFRRSDSAFDLRSQITLRPPQVGPLHVANSPPERGWQCCEQCPSAFHVHSYPIVSPVTTLTCMYLNSWYCIARGRYSPESNKRANSCQHSLVLFVKIDLCIFPQ